VIDRRARRRAAHVALPAALVGSLVCAATALAYVTSDLIDFNLSESVSTYGGGTQYHIATGTDGWSSFRWLDSPNKVTVISNNACTDLSNLGSSSYGVGDTSYHALFQGTTSQCFVVRGRTASGQGTMVNHDGREQR
jgi:hypothetical protein